MTINNYQQVPGGVIAPLGFLAAGIKAGIKKNGNPDMALIYSQVPAQAAGVFTVNVVKAAPVLLCQEHLQAGESRAIIVNAGNANACNGERGMADARRMAEATAQALGVEPREVLVASTGVIGVPLPMERVVPGIAAAAKALDRKGGPGAAEAIMTTDTFPKTVAICFSLGGKEVTIGAMAKGSGMIHPNMATMLGFVTTDAAISPGLLQQALKETVADSFNMITVDGDTSTNDSVLLLANGLAGNPLISETGEDYRTFREALQAVLTYLAKEVARDGEGATKLIEVRVLGAPTVEDARKGAIAIAKSSLVKAAFFGEDANWGRILCALGYSGAQFDPNRVDILLGDEPVARDGGSLEFSEERAKEILAQKEIVVTVDMKQGKGKATAWGCDLTYDYVKINGSYRT